MEMQPQGANIGQPQGEPRIPRRVDTEGQPMPGHRLDQPRPTGESQEQQNAPKKSEKSKEKLLYWAFGSSLAVGAGVSLWFGFS